jgi:hypothetical protein
MNETKICRVAVEVVDGGGRWERNFAGQPTSAEVIDALEDERLAKRQKHVDSGATSRATLVDSLYANLSLLITQNGLPQGNNHEIQCEYNGERIGRIRLTVGDGICVTAAGGAV